MLEFTEVGSAYAPFAESYSTNGLTSSSAELSYSDLLTNMRNEVNNPKQGPSTMSSAPKVKLTSSSPSESSSTTTMRSQPPAPPFRNQQQYTTSTTASKVQMQPTYSQSYESRSSVPQALQEHIPPNQHQPDMSQQYMPAHFDSNAFNRQFEMSQKKMQQQNAVAPLQVHQYPNNVYTQQQHATMVVAEDGYWEKLSIKKKDIWKFMQSGFIILFAISIHYFIDFILKHYLSNHDISFERELFIRILYPVAVLFLAWNIIAHLR